MRPPPASSPDSLVREYIGEIAARAAIYSQHAADYATLGDDKALARAMRMLTTLAISGAECLPQLAEAVAATERLNAAARTVAEDRRPGLRGHPLIPIKEQGDGRHA